MDVVLVFKGMRALSFAVVASSLFSHLALAGDFVVTPLRFYTTPYLIEDDEQAQNLITALREMVSKNLLVANSHDKSKVEGYVEKLREYMMTKYKTKDLAKIGIAEKELQEIQRSALDQMVCHDRNALKQILSSKDISYFMANRLLNAFKLHNDRSKVHYNDLYRFDAQTAKLKCEIAKDELAQWEGKVLALKSQSQNIAQQGSSMNQAENKGISGEISKPSSAKEQSILGK
jgi:hypothetical protein